MSAAIDTPSAQAQFRSRHFSETDPFGRKWHVEFLWQQTGISIRHADTVDVRFELASGAEKDGKVIALPHPLLLNQAEMSGHELNDAWCLRLASAHLRQMIDTWQDMDKPLVTLTAEELDAAARMVAKTEARIAERY